MEDGYSMRSRTTARSRRSSMSRNSQLIKKNTGPHELRPSDLLIDRFVAWKHITKNLIAYFEGIADIESNTAKELTKLGGVIQVPFRQGNQFLGEGGMQDIFYGIRDKTRLIADHHANLSRTIESSIVLHLQKLRTEIKAHIKNIQLDTGKLANSVAKERELSTKVITDLARSITLLKNTPMQVTAKEDPWYCAGVVMRQLQKQVQEENALQKSIIIMQQNSEHFEEGVVRAIQTAWQTFDEWSNRMSVQVSQTWQDMGIMMRSIGPTTEWVAFASRTDHLLDPDTPLRNPETIEFPGKNDPSCIPVHNGLLERKKRFTRNYKEGYYVLTAAGYLHEHSSSDLTRHGQPVLSLFLPECILGAPSSQHAKSHKFHVEGKHSASGALAGLMPKKGSTLLGGSEHAYTFRFRSHDEMMEWWNDMKQLSKVYLTSSDVMDRSGPVPAAVRAAGYISEDEDDEEEEDGSSVEEEEDDDEEEEEEPVRRSQDHHHHHHRTQQPAHIRDDIPDYAPPATNSGIAIGKNGYAVEKKGEGSGGLGRKSSRREEKQPETQPPASQAAVPGAGLPAREG